MASPARQGCGARQPRVLIDRAPGDNCPPRPGGPSYYPVPLIVPYNLKTHWAEILSNPFLSKSDTERNITLYLHISLEYYNGIIEYNPS